MMKIGFNSNSKEEKSAVVAALFIFQYSLLIPFMRFFPLGVMAAISGITLVLAALYINRRIVVAKKMVAILFSLVVVFLIKILIDGSEPIVLVNFLMIAIPPVVVFSYQFDRSKFLEWCCKLSIVNFLLLFLTPFFGRIAYMRFGYSMVLTSIFSYIMFFHPNYLNHYKTIEHGKTSKRLVEGFVLVVSLVETIIFGSRGAIVVFLAFVFIDILLIYKTKVFRNAVLMLVGFIGLFNLEHILNVLISIASRLNVNSYALQKYQFQLTHGLSEASSGRNRLYAEAWESIKENLLIGSRMINYDDGELYTHNLFLQVGKDIGIIAMILTCVFVLYCLYLMFAKRLDKKEKTVLAVLFVVSVVRLLLSSNLWERPEFWMLVCFVMSHRTLKTEKSTKGECMMINREANSRTT